MNKLAQNIGTHGENEVENQWSRVTQAIKECATDVVGWAEKTKRKDWFNDKCQELIAKRTTLKYKITLIKIGKNMNREEKKLMQSLKEKEKKDYI